MWVKDDMGKEHINIIVYGQMFPNKKNTNLAEKTLKSLKIYFQLENKVVFWEAQSLEIK